MAERRFEVPKVGFRIGDGSVGSLGQYRAKISGTMAGAILGCNPYMSEFETACRLLGITSEAGVGDKPAVRTGRILESRIIDYVSKNFGLGTVMTARDVFGECETGDHEEWIPHFHDPVFTGHVDGIVSRDGTDYILEVKTARDIGKWIDDDGDVAIPEHYLRQVELYNNFLTKQDKAYIVLGAVDERAYADPDSWVPVKDVTVAVYTVNIDQERVARDVERLRAWYAEYIAEGRTPAWDPDNERDMQVVHFLESFSASSEDIQSMIAEYTALDAEIKAYDSVIADKRRRLDDIKDTITEHMTARDVRILTDPDGAFEAKVTVRNTRKWDEKRMTEDGIDTARYQTVSTSKYVTISKARRN